MWHTGLEPSNDCTKPAWDVERDGYLDPGQCIFYYDTPLVWTEQDHRFLVVALDATCGKWSREDQTATIEHGEYTTVVKGPQWLRLVAELSDEDREKMRPENSNDGDLRNRIVRDAKGIWIELVGPDSVVKSWRVKYEDIHRDFLPFSKEE